ncbi:MAG: family 10 glycosylhydrolase [Xenococcaceae cyanobacterium]
MFSRRKSALGKKSVLKASPPQRFFRSLVAGLVTIGSLVSQCWLGKPVQAQTRAYCQFTQEAIAAKENLLQGSLKGNSDAQRNYKALLKKHGEILRQCRARTWPQNQAIWVRLYPCDVRPGSIDYLLDRIVNRGYNKIYLEVFFDSQVLLPPADNPTPWGTVVRSPGAETVDLLAQTIQKGHERGLQVYAWMFTMNFGYAYAHLPNRQRVLARNGKGEDSLSFVHDRSQAFIDPYHTQAQTDYYQLVEAVIKRRPDGVLFDYIRYPRGTGSQSLVSQVKDLWIYGDASRQALYQRAQNNKGRALIERYVSKGDITMGDVAAVNKLYPQEGAPLWEGRNSSASGSLWRLRLDLWHLSVAHAAQGVLDFLTLASFPVQRQGIPVGAVFFPHGNQVVGQTGFDSRLQAWDKFPASMEWHPMSYAVCGNTNCIVEEVQRVKNMAPRQTKVNPVIAGVWGKDYNNHPSLEAQMQAIRSAVPQVNSVSHFAYSWQEPEFDRERRFCN